jgi:translocation and assembly module TamB
MRKLPRRLTIWLLIATALALASFVAGISVLRSNWFYELVRKRILYEVENATGGRAELASYSFEWNSLRAQVHGFVLHGTEAAGQEPLFRADAISVGLNITSMLRREINVASVDVTRPRAHILVRPDGTSNIPGPRVQKTHRDPIDQIFELKIGRFTIRDGSVLYNSETIPLDVSGEGLRAGLTYESAGPQYRGRIGVSDLLVSRPLAAPLRAAAQSAFLFRRNQIVVSSLRLSLPESSIEASGQVDDLASPHGNFSASATLLAAELARSFHIPELKTGTVQWSGNGSFRARPPMLAIDGRFSGSGVSYRNPAVEVRNAGLSGNLDVSESGVRVDDLSVSSSAGKFRGTLDLKDWRDLRLRGDVSSLSLQAAAAAVRQQGLPWSANLRGPVQLSATVGRAGISGLAAAGHLDVLPAGGGVPASGALDWKYSQKPERIEIGKSEFTVGSSRIQVSGALGSRLQVDVVSHNLNDVVPALRLAGLTQPEPLPVSLKEGTVHVTASVVGNLRDPGVEGHLEATNVVFRDHKIDRISSDFEVNRLLLRLEKTEVAQGPAAASGRARAALMNWKIEPSSVIEAAIKVRNADVAALLAQAGSKLPVSGVADADLQVANTFGDPQVRGSLRAVHGKAWDQPFDLAKSDVQLDGPVLHLAGASITAGKANGGGSITYRRVGEEWGSGDLQFDISATIPDVTKVELLRTRFDGFAAGGHLEAAGAGRLSGNGFLLSRLNGTGSIDNVAFRGEALGSASFTASTSGTGLKLQARGTLLDSKFDGNGEWLIGGDHSGKAKVDFTPLSLRRLIGFLANEKTEQELDRYNFSGSVGGTLTVEGPFDSLDRLRAELRLPAFELRGAPQMEVRAGAKAQDLLIRSTGPVTVDLTSKSATIRAADFTARDTKLSVGGVIAFDPAVPSSLTIDGSINLAILQLLNRDLLAAGHARVSASLRGTLAKPELAGRMELNNASLFLPDFPNGIDNANGVIAFDRNRATIRSLSAETGGGRISFSGFVGFGSLLVYNLEATADQVRYRTPEGASVTANALLSLAGTSESSVLSGSVSLIRANLPPLTDLGSLMAASSRPTVSAEEPNAFLRGIHLDIAIESAQSLEVRTSLARDLQTTIDLRLRGTPQKTSLLGTVSVNQGEIEFFGTRYIIDRGEVTFSDPLKIEPHIDASLETRVRGIEVNLTLTGTTQKLNLSYRSDPPLESGQIVALLAVGRDPTSQGLINPNSTQGSAFSGGAGSLLAGALTAPLTSRLDRLFGGSRIKIDPQATDLTTIPQARLVFEQPISRDITLTYITNLNRTDEQVVRVQWDLNTNWSAVASREENGLFGVVFQFRKRFK